MDGYRPVRSEGILWPSACVTLARNNIANSSAGVGSTVPGATVLESVAVSVTDFVRA